ncbi:lipid-binding SYLF domain-containing protein [Roseomonas sp. SSH11]|uniref:Lipid-binding SYLF domain-containing protein n=1 Tax=Pararoseomonas baculiformis TaxID=2820812 RepID=A0ABS4AB51_9PROT|nr:lipid-binding SYLF domain-containing protein [Pararoseomonas baculiformis]MBP0444226.1 lipid-binding SYLF domain-containing protein [Pararoseomonas baculiformis]
MRRRMIALAALAALALGAQPRTALAQTEQTLVDRAALTVGEMLGSGDPNVLRDATQMLAQSRAVIICPRIFRAGFLFGGQGGDCVLMARDGAGSWSSPAFYTIGSASFGLQIGVQDMQVMMMVLTDKGLGAVMDSQIKIGADAAIALATIGGGIAGATTAAVGADIVSYARTRGLYAGISLEGSLLSSRSDFNTGYYGRPLGTRQIVIDMQAHNPAADPLRAALMRFSAPGGGMAPSPMAAAPAGPGQMQIQPAPTGGVMRETLR